MNMFMNALTSNKTVYICILAIQFLGNASAQTYREHKSIETTGSGYNRVTKGNQDIRQSSDGTIFQVKVYSNGAVLKSKKTTIYFGESCDARSPEYGNGTWRWANGGFRADLEKKVFGFPRQPAPIETLNCQF